MKKFLSLLLIFFGAQCIASDVVREKQDPSPVAQVEIMYILKKARARRVKIIFQLIDKDNYAILEDLLKPTNHEVKNASGITAIEYATKKYYLYKRHCLYNRKKDNDCFFKTVQVVYAHAVRVGESEFPNKIMQKYAQLLERDKLCLRQAKEKRKAARRVREIRIEEQDRVKQLKDQLVARQVHLNISKRAQKTAERSVQAFMKSIGLGYES